MTADENSVTSVSNIGTLASHSQRVTFGEDLNRDNRLIRIEIEALKSQISDADKGQIQ